jgi:hypothetical protein
LKLIIRKNLAVVLFSAIIIASISSCDKFEGDQTIPSYIRIDSFHLVENHLLELGVMTQNISDVWVYCDDQLIGAFELPAERIPILLEGNHRISLYAGIKYNSLSGTRGPYPFFQPYKDTAFNLVKDSILIMTPTITYYNNTYIAWYEDFEDETLSLESTVLSDTSMMLFTIDSADAVHGDYCAVGYLAGDDAVLETASHEEDVAGIELPKSSAPVFLEMEYNTNCPLVVGLIVIDVDVQTFSHPVLVLNSTNGKWNKVYVNMSPAVSDYYSAEYFNVFFRIEKTNASDTAKIYLDNLKLLSNQEPNE